MQKLLNASAMAYCALMVFALWGWWRFFRGLRARRATEMQEAAFREAERHSLNVRLFRYWQTAELERLGRLEPQEKERQ